MIWKAKYTEEKFNDGANRLKRVFAWLPKKINGDVVWLEYYEVLQRYTVQQYILFIQEKQTVWNVSQWINLDYRLIK